MSCDGVIGVPMERLTDTNFSVQQWKEFVCRDEDSSCSFVELIITAKMKCIDALLSKDTLHTKLRQNLKIHRSTKKIGIVII